MESGERGKWRQNSVFSYFIRSGKLGRKEVVLVFLLNLDPPKKKSSNHRINKRENWKELRIMILSLAYFTMPKLEHIKLTQKISSI